jgi:hypothetical protein
VSIICPNVTQAISASPLRPESALARLDAPPGPQSPGPPTYRAAAGLSSCDLLVFRCPFHAHARTARRLVGWCWWGGPHAHGAAAAVALELRDMVGRTDHWMLPLPRPVAQPAGMAWLLLLAAEPCEQRQITYAYIHTYALGRFLGVGTRNKHVLLARAGKKARARRAGSGSQQLGSARTSSTLRTSPSRACFSGSWKERASSARLGAARELARGSTQQQFVT